MMPRHLARAAGAAALAAACMMASAPTTLARAPAIRPAPTLFVTDDAGVLSAATESALEAQLEGYQRQSGHQVVVYVGVTTGDVPIEDWAVRAFERWGIGRKGKDDGVLLAVFREDRHARIEVGYGLEDKLTDLQSNRILQEQVLPRLTAGDPNGAITAGVQAILAAIEGRAPPAPAVAPPTGTQIAPQPVELTPLQTAILWILGLLVLAFLVTHPRVALWLLWTIATSSGRSSGGGGFGGGGGGFSGGGGRSGGGGASGSW